MITSEAIAKIERLMNFGASIQLRNCCQYRKKEIEYYSKPRKHTCYGTFKLEEYSNGFYYGGFNSSRERQGFGYYVWENGSIYSGNWKNNKKHGDGINIFSDGFIRFGEYSNGELDGHCLERSSNGIEIEIDYEDGKRVKVWDTSDAFIEDGRRYNRKNNFSGSGSGGWVGTIVFGIIILFIIQTCI